MMLIQLKQTVPCPPLPKNLDEKRPVVGTVCSTGVVGDSIPAAVETIGQSDETELEGHEHNVQLLTKGGDSARLSAPDRHR